MIELFFKPLKEDARKPIQANELDAGWDLFALEDVIIYPGTKKKLSTGIAVQGKFIDEEDAKKFKLEFKIEGTSGNAAKLGIFPIGGVVDEGYIGEVGVILVNSERDPVKIVKGGKIAQLVPHVIPKISKVTYLGINGKFPREETSRGSDGFGSTGIATSL